MTLKRVRIERVQRLSEFQHDVIGRIGDIVDGSLPERFQSRLEPIWRGPDLYPGDVTAAISSAQVGIRDGNREDAF